MYKKPIIGIVGRSYEKENVSVIETNENYRLAIVESGGIPIIIVPTNDLKYGTVLPRNAGHLTDDNKEDLLCVLKMCDGILMTGGFRWYEFDEIICRYVIDNDIPVLGICMGMQILGNIDNFCGDIRSDKTILNDTSLEHYQIGIPYVHKIKILSGKLRDILETDEVMVNSRHNYHIIGKDWFNIDAYSEDGLIEAIDIPNRKFALGLQWHPEDMISYDNPMCKIFDEFIKSCKEE